MAQFRAVIQGNRGDVSRLGSKQSNIYATVQSWEGQINVMMWHRIADNGCDGGDWVRVTLTPHNQACDTGACVCLYEGPCDGWKARLAMTAVRVANRELVTSGVKS